MNKLKNEVKANNNNSKGKKAKKKKPSPGFTFSSIKDFFINEKFHKITGAFFILFSVFLILSLTSYYFTWVKDDTIINGSANLLGKAGAGVSKFFIKHLFGAASYLFVLLFFISGVKLLFKTSILPLGKTFAYSLFGLLWISTAFGFIANLTGNQDFTIILSGAMGYQMNAWFYELISTIGTFLLLLFTFIAFLIIAFNPSFVIWNTKKPAAVAVDEEGFTKVNYDEVAEEAAKATTVDLEVSSEEEEKEEPEEKDLQEEEAEEEFETVEDSDIELTIESKTESQEAESEEEEEPQVHYKTDTPYDPKLDLPDYKFPNTDLLDEYDGNEVNVQKDELEANKNKIVSTLKNYGIAIEKIKATIGPTVTLYELVPAAGVRISKIKGLEDDIAMSLSALGIRIIAPMPGKGTIGIEVPNKNPEIVSMKSLLSSEKFVNSKFELPISLGKTISNDPYIVNLVKLPHILMAGATGQGKSVGLNAILTSLLYKKHPAEIKFVLIDPKKVELTLYEKIERHFLAKLPDSEEAIITDTRKVVRTLNSLCIEMDDRFNLLKDAQVRNIQEYNEKFISRKLVPSRQINNQQLNGELSHRYLPYIVLVVDEFADLIMTAGKEVETPLTRLAQLARAVGIHLIIATQRPTVNIITGTIKANFPARIAFRVVSKIDSRTVLDTNGADQLVGRGDMLLATGSDVIRLQCAFIDIHELERLTSFIGDQRAYPDAYNLPDYQDEGEESAVDIDPSERDEFFEDAAKLIVQSQHGSTSLIQRKLKLGYNRAGRIIDQLEAAGIIGPFEGSKAREVKIKDEMSLAQLLQKMKENE